MQAIELLPEMLWNGMVTLQPRRVRTPAIDYQLRRGIVGRVQGIILGDNEEGRAMLRFECANATVDILLSGEEAKHAVEVLKGLPVNYPHKRRADMQDEGLTTDTDREKADLSLLTKVGGPGRPE